jgi:hypothetical protein
LHFSIDEENAMVKHTFISILIGTAFCALCFSGTANAQYRSSRWINSGTTVNVRTIENINTNNSNGRVFQGVVDDDVYDRHGNLIIPRGSDVELIARRVSNNEVALDLDSITVDGERYGVGAGAAGGVGAQILTRGRKIVPAESLLTFNLTQPFQAGVYDQGYMRNGYHYHPGYGNGEYEQGFRDGRGDASRNLALNAHARRFPTQQQRQHYEAGYNDGYRSNSEVARLKPGYDYGHGNGGYSNVPATISIDRHNNVNWQASPSARIYVQEDNQNPKLFASGQSGSQPATWMQSGHLYTFILQDANGNEIARTVQDLR